VDNLGTYKWFILLNTTFGFIFQIFSVIFKVFPLLPYPILVLHGASDVWIWLFDLPVMFLAYITPMC
jgi:hypothetical protein